MCVWSCGIILEPDEINLALHHICASSLLCLTTWPPPPPCQDVYVSTPLSPSLLFIFLLSPGLHSRPAHFLSWLFKSHRLRAWRSAPDMVKMVHDVTCQPFVFSLQVCVAVPVCARDPTRSVAVELRHGAAVFGHAGAQPLKHQQRGEQNCKSARGEHIDLRLSVHSLYIGFCWPTDLTWAFTGFLKKKKKLTIQNA